MADLKPGTIVQGGSWGQGTNWMGIVVRGDGSTLQILNPGLTDFTYRTGFLRRLTGAKPEVPHIPTVLKGEFSPHGLTATPIREPKAAVPNVESALMEFLDSIAPGAGTELSQSPAVDTTFLAGEFSGMKMTTTASGFRIAADVSEFESRDMVQIEHAWRWAVLFKPLVVVGVYQGDRGKHAQVVHELPLPAGAVETLFTRLGAL